MLSWVYRITKTSNATSIKDYQPISVLSVLSKVYERVFLNQLSSFIETQNLYNIDQSGFHKGRSTNTLLLKSRDDIRTAMDRSEVTSSGLIDYSKAFDNIDYCNLLGKLQNMNFVKYTNMLPICTIRTQEINPITSVFACTSGEYTRHCTI